MGTTLVSAGLVCLIAAVIGGGLSAFGITIPILQSRRRQLALGLLGLVLLLGGIAVTLAGKPEPSPVTPGPAASSNPSSTVRSALLAELHQNNEDITELEADLATHKQQIETQEGQITDLKGQIDRGEGTADEIVQAQAQIQRTQAALAQARNMDARARALIDTKKQRNADIERTLASN